MAKLLSGKEAAASLDAKLVSTAEKLRAQGVMPRLAVIRCGEDSSDLAYERGILKKAEKIGVEAVRIHFPADTDKEPLIAKIRELNEDPSVHGVLLFRPLPKPLKKDSEEICNTLDPAKDVDAMTDLSCAGVYEGKDLGFTPCTPEACLEILDFYGIDLTGKDVTVIGRSLVVGRPAAMMLMKRNATVTICHTKTKDVPAAARRADVIVSAVGKLNTLTGDYVREGQIVLDVSVNWDPEKNDGQGGLAGDAVFDEVSPVVDAITPVPGGVGSVTTSVLMKHVLEAAVRSCC